MTSDRPKDPTTQFEASRPHLRAVAFRMLGSSSEAEDAVQEAWLRLNRTDADTVDNMTGWLTTVVARVCLDMLRTRKSRREELLDAPLPEATAEDDGGLADAVGPALLLVLETLAPAERLAFVLHDMFGVSFEQIAPIVERTPAAARQLASRARRRVQGAPVDTDGPETERQRALVDAFLAASRDGNFAALLAVLAPDVVLRADAEAQRLGAPAELRGAEALTRNFAGRARGARRAILDGVAAATWAPGGVPKVVFSFRFVDETIVGIDLFAEPAHLQTMDLSILD